MMSQDGAGEARTYCKHCRKGPRPGTMWRRDKGERKLKAMLKRPPTGHDKAPCCDATEGERTGEHIYTVLLKGSPDREQCGAATQRDKT